MFPVGKKLRDTFLEKKTIHVFKTLTIHTKTLYIFIKPFYYFSYFISRPPLGIQSKTSVSGLS